MTPLPRTPSFRLDGRCALVTGASRGIGLGCAAALAEAGAHVVCAARGLGALEDVVGSLRAAGLSAEALQLDVDNPADAAAAIDKVGPFDIFVSNAGAARHAPMVETSVADFDAVVGVNLRGAYFATQAVARGMVKAGKGGSIMTISSQMGHVGGIDRTVYSATKHAIEGMTKSAAIELGPHNIRVNTICPTFIRTPLSEPTFSNPERAAWIASKIKLRRVGKVEDIMGAVVFLAGDASAMITGTSLLIDGGWTAG
ncbi:SDR family NAD(P)-dependent oxidoreductase [Aminobacter aminovorans]|jgi:NAD(P)-dependent dehydrogenase (short-subunit alcohol dehydrogenase family)|uniref:2-deoxy-D-gluconate 3-dehydrogenase n=1 Tax=Aminobacter aminovorans TaxID=83263 RepID=A0AAC8YVQ8_AMIAI|nr:SDR family NAD(P)-dependent oxidoreductase [Aminobacter aminovorans]AMS45174.1 Short-chain dehydrogenase/reductase [Aminobacter aminovorans]MBB3705068.1 2-deoxy-D-gluconate 3-dehydrogenase [Aminobacter aminovorans]